MLENAQIIALQLIKMFIFIAIGFLLFKGKLITEKSSLALVNVLIYAIIPCVILDPLIGERTGDSIRIFLISLGAGGLALLASLLIAWIFFRKNPIEHYGAAFSNAGFMGFPLIVAVLGEAGTIYITGFFLLHSIGQWVYNILLMKPKVEKPNIKGLFLSPIMISLAVGLIIFLPCRLQQSNSHDNSGHLPWKNKTPGDIYNPPALLKLSCTAYNNTGSYGACAVRRPPGTYGRAHRHIYCRSCPCSSQHSGLRPERRTGLHLRRKICVPIHASVSCALPPHGALRRIYMGCISFSSPFVI